MQLRHFRLEIFWTFSEGFGVFVAHFFVNIFHTEIMYRLNSLDKTFIRQICIIFTGFWNQSTNVHNEHNRGSYQFWKILSAQITELWNKNTTVTFWDVFQISCQYFCFSTEVSGMKHYFYLLKKMKKVVRSIESPFDLFQH